MAVDINGDGLIGLGGTSTTQGRLRLFEDTDNGTNYIEITAPASVASNRTITLPDNTGTVLTTASTFAGTGPAFSAYKSADQTITSNATWTKITFNTEDFDTNCNFASDRFTPTVAGYYQINFLGVFESLVQQNNLGQVAFYKNGSAYRTYRPVSAGAVATNNETGTCWNISSSLTMYMNGTTDYVEMYAYQTYGNNGMAVRTEATFSGFLARAA